MSAIAGTRTLVSAACRGISPARRTYVLLLLTLVNALNYLDRQVLTILLEPIRHELSLSDTQIGFLTGIAFTLLYVLLGIPAARLADGWSRRKIIAISVGVWSIMTSLCGAARSYGLLLAARMGVGVGESGGNAPCHALVSDLYPRDARGTAMSVFLLAVPIGMALGMLWGGWAEGYFGWRGAFVLAGLPGLLVCPLVLFTVPELPRGLSDGALQQLTPPPFWKTIRCLISIGAFRNMMFASMMNNFLSLGLSAWIPSFLGRSYHLSPARIGASLALAFALPYALGVLLGGRLVDLAGRRTPRWHFLIPCISTPIAGLLAVVVFSASSTHIFVFMALYYLFVSLFAAPAMVIVQNLSPIAFRATGGAFMLFVINAVGVGLGPQVLGIVSDLLRPAFGEESLRVALLTAAALFIPTSYFYYRASRTYCADLASAEQRNADAIGRVPG